MSRCVFRNHIQYKTSIIQITIWLNRLLLHSKTLSDSTVEVQKYKEDTTDLKPGAINPSDVPAFDELAKSAKSDKHARDRAIQTILEYERINFRKNTFIYVVGVCFCSVQAILIFLK